MALPADTMTETEARLAGFTRVQDGWTATARAEAETRLRASGLPGRRDEYWKFTRPDALTAESATAALGPEETAQLSDAALKIVFVDGVFDAAASDDLSLEGVRLDRLADAQSDIHWARDLYGTLEEAGQTPVVRPLAALNTAFATDGVLIRVTQEVTRPICLIYKRESVDADVLLHHVVKVEDGATLTLLEEGTGAARLNTVLEVDVAEGAAFHHVRLQGRDAERLCATHCFARLAAQSVFKSFTLTAHGAMTRNECIVELVGDEGVAHVAGACIGNGAFHHDDTVFVTHDALNCESRQVFKKVLRNGATGVFQGKILVKEGAQKTDGYQISQSLLLDDDSQFLAKPELEIYADDVACSHGSTSGAIDETALFYLRSRGIPANEATDLLTLAFLAEALEEIEAEELRDAVAARLELWLPRH